MNAQDQQKAKKAAAKYAVDLIENGMVIGIGSGSTVFFFIEALGEKCRAGLKIKALSTSKKTELLALKAGIPMLDSYEVDQLDLDVDGADEIDKDKNMLKGGGGALLREKIVAKMSKEMIVIVDSSKEVEALGKFPLPVEIAPFAMNATKRHLIDHGFLGSFRKNKEKELYITDNGNVIYDISLNHLIDNPQKIELSLRNIPGVLETGLFIKMAGRVIIGFDNGLAIVK